MRELVHELFQTETSASLHCRREARRLADAPPARTLFEAAEHADAVLGQLPGLMRRHGLPVSRAGSMVGALFSATRQRLADRMLSRERSYRGTLLGMRHGAGVVILLGEVAQRAGAAELAEFCKSWLLVRVPLIERAERDLVWFAQHSAAAIEASSNKPVEPAMAR